MSTQVRSVVLVFDGRGGDAEFYGVFSSRSKALDMITSRCNENELPEFYSWNIELRSVNKQELEILLEEDLTDQEWEDFFK